MTGDVTMKKLILLCVLALASFLAAQTKPYRGAELRTRSTFQYGRFEVRMKSAAGSGLLSSFFTFHDSWNLPAEWNEIDIEILGRYNNQIQFNVISPGQVNHVKSKILKYNPHQAFHVYTIDWTPDYVAWWVDGFEIYRQYGTHIQQIVHPQKIMMNIWPPDYPGWVGVLDPGILPVFAYYDWVKCYNYTPGTGDNFTLLWADDFDYWNTSRWDKATHTWNGNNSNFIPENVVFQDGYMILCLTTPQNIGYNGNPIVDQDVDPPYVVWARSFPGEIRVYFSEPVDPTTAQDPANYIIPGVTINQAVLRTDQRTVELSVDSLDLTTHYNLIVSGIADLTQPPNVMGLEHTVVQTSPILPLSVNVGGEMWNGYQADQLWYDSLGYGRVGGTVITDTNLIVSGTSEPELYQSEVRGITFYEVRVPDGHYRVTLMFAETEYSSAGLRVFDVYAESELQQSNVDIYAAVGANTAYEVVLSDLEVTDGILELYFKPHTGKPVLSGLKVEVNPAGLPQGEVQVPEYRWQIFPNPFNQRTNVFFTIEKPAPVTINIFDVTGRFVHSMKKSVTSTGFHNLTLDFSRLGSGVYFCQIVIGGHFRDVRKIVYLK